MNKMEIRPVNVLTNPSYRVPFAPHSFAFLPGKICGGPPPRQTAAVIWTYGQMCNEKTIDFVTVLYYDRL